MTLLRVGRMVAVLAVVVAEFGCGDTFRPVVTPINSIPPNPSSLHYALVLSSNGVCNPPAVNQPCDPGASTRIDVSGDTEVGSALVGLNPVHAVLSISGAAVYVANQLEDSISVYDPSGINPVSTVSLPVGSAPVFVATTQVLTVYVANSGNGTVSVVAAGSNVVTNTIAVGLDPDALAVMPNGQKLYVANHGTGANPVNGSVLSVNTVDNSVNSPLAPPGGSSWNAPTWIVARSDNARVYVLDQGTGTVAAIATASDAVVGTASVGAGANYMLYDRTRNRIYVTNPVARTLTILDASTRPATNPPTDPLTVLSSFNFAAAGAPCPGGCIPVSVAALPDGSRAYVASYQTTPNPCISNQPCAITSWLTVINASSNTVSKTISLGVVNPNAPISVPPTFQPDTPVVPACATPRFRLFAAASADSSRVYVSYCDAGATASVSTQPNTSPGTLSAGDYLVNELVAPASALPPGSSGQPPPQTPVFVLAAP